MFAAEYINLHSFIGFSRSVIVHFDNVGNLTGQYDAIYADSEQLFSGSNNYEYMHLHAWTV